MPRLVLVCDRPQAAAELGSALRAAGHDVEVAHDAYRALELAERSKPEVVVMRAGLPGRPIGDVVARLRANVAAPKVVVLLPDHDPERAAAALRAGADGALGPEAQPSFVAWAVERAAEGGLVISPALARDLVIRFADAVHREREWSRSLADSARHAEELSRAKADLLANVSHELRTPLTVIKGLVGVLRRADSDPEEQEEFLRLVEEAADKLTRMIENLVTLSEMERGAFRLELHPCDLSELVVEGAAQAGEGYPHVTVDVFVPGPIPATADAARIREAVRQLVDNACRFSAPGDVVNVRTRVADEGITVHVADRGRGIRRELIAAAFGQPFTPGEEILTKERAGLGLGLNLARNLVVLHGGIMWAEPLPRGGTRVAFTLPPGGSGTLGARPETAAPDWGPGPEADGDAAEGDEIPALVPDVPPEQHLEEIAAEGRLAGDHLGVGDRDEPGDRDRQAEREPEDGDPGGAPDGDARDPAELEQLPTPHGFRRLDEEERPADEDAGDASEAGAASEEEDGPVMGRLHRLGGAGRRGRKGGEAAAGHPA